MLAYKW